MRRLRRPDDKQSHHRSTFGHNKSIFLIEQAIPNPRFIRKYKGPRSLSLSLSLATQMRRFYARGSIQGDAKIEAEEENIGRWTYEVRKERERSFSSLTHIHLFTHGNKRKFSRREIVIVYLCMRRHGSRYSTRFPRGKEKIARELSIRDMIIGCCWVRRFSKAHPCCCRIFTPIRRYGYPSLGRPPPLSSFRVTKNPAFDFSGFTTLVRTRFRSFFFFKYAHFSFLAFDIIAANVCLL